MKKIFQIILISFILIGCSSIDYSELTSPTSPTDDQISRILSLNLSYAESLNEANKIMNPDLAALVVKELEARKVQENTVNFQSEKVAEYIEKIKITNNNTIFSGPKISDTRKRGLLVNVDFQDYFLRGVINTSGEIEHQVHLSLKYTANQKRIYNSANYCDRWQGCSGGDKLDILLLSSNASNCESNFCDYNEKMSLNLSNDFLENSLDYGFSISFNSKRASNKITISAPYLIAYLQVAK